MTSISCYAVRHTSMVRHALILAADAAPVATGDAQLPLCGGRSSPDRTHAAWAGRRGCRRVGIVWVGKAMTARALKPCARGARPSTEILFIDNPAWEKPNGLSVLAARSFVTERTLLVMADKSRRRTWWAHGQAARERAATVLASIAIVACSISMTPQGAPGAAQAARPCAT